MNGPHSSNKRVLISIQAGVFLAGLSYHRSNRPLFSRLVSSGLYFYVECGVQQSKDGLISANTALTLRKKE